MTTTNAAPASHRACYVNFAEHLQNAWNPNLYYPGAPNQWSAEDWRRFFRMLYAFGFNVFEYWVPPTLMDRPALTGSAVHANFAGQMRQVTQLAHETGLRVKFIGAVNTIGPGWYFACPNDPADRKLILDLWRHWLRELPETDIVGIFPGDPGGCNRNGCSHETFVDLALEICGLIQRELPRAAVDIGTWDTPFSGWGTDLIGPPSWDGGTKQLLRTEASRRRVRADPEWQARPGTSGHGLLRQASAREFPADAMAGTFPPKTGPG